MKEEIVHFELAYTRDTSFIPQEVWSKTQNGSLEEILGEKNPHAPFVINYMYKGAIEIWENVAAMQWVKDSLLARSEKDLSFLSSNIREHKKFLEQLKPYWERGYAQSIENLLVFLDTTFKANLSFMIWYLSATDDRTSSKMRKELLEFRDKDLFYERTDRVVRTTLLRLFPELKGVETTLLWSELNKPFPPRDVLEQRKRKSVLIPDVYFVPISLKNYLKDHPTYHFDFPTLDSEKNKEVRGQVAHKGLARGKVRVLRRKEQIAEVLDGDILVAPMTTPDYLPAMKKAAAFVTDEGGITCHAAIVARELKKPCIIGTKIATKVLKDGDMVEVDAEKGVVRRLS